ncbi:MAG: hypothetical protein HYV18_01570 [Gammaproteobacteria bacterium]|nr:hypothetical protein [Gammaproteobacteria bacterium]
MRFSNQEKVVTVLLGVVCTIALVACGGGGGSKQARRQAAHFTPGTTTMVVPADTIGADGAVLIAPEGSALAGVTVEIPPGALSEDREIGLSLDSGTVSTPEGVPGPALVLDTDGPATFERPVRITIPYRDEDTIPVPYYVDDAGNLQLAQLTALDLENRTATFDTFHASTFTWILASIRDALDGSFRTSFAVGEDGFQIANSGSEYNREGECFGISSFSLWYFENMRSREGNLYPRFMNPVGTDSEGQTRVGQHVIATRAFTSIAQQWTTYYNTIVRDELALPLNGLLNYVVITNALQTTQSPVLLYLWRSDGQAAHSVLATAYDHGEISIYDVNFPNSVRTIAYDSASDSFLPYASGSVSFDRVNYSGDGSLYLTEPYENILADAKDNFHSSADATISVSSHHSGQQVSERIVSLAGTIESSQVLVEQLTVYVGSTAYKTTVAEDGAFRIVVSIASGVNHLRFETFGRDFNSQENRADLIEVPNNMRTEDFTLDGLFVESVIRINLTWDTNDTDVDLYVIDPVGDYSAYYHPTTGDGGFLDHDVTTGYGPENWLLTTANTIRWDEPYLVRVHYYNSRGRGPTNYTVGVQLYDGPRAVTSYYRGTLSASNGSNTAPDAEGPDWADVVLVVPRQAQNARAASRAMAIQSKSSGSWRIRAPVPPQEQRRK